MVGGGAAGCMAALTAAASGVGVVLLERNQKLGRKLYITGKGRCNVTNDCDARTALENTPHNGRFLSSAMTRFPPASVKEFFESRGVPLKTERGNRVFPVSDRAADIIDTLLMALRKAGVDIREDRATHVLVKSGAIVGVETEDGAHLPCRSVILATGGASYPATGSTGDGYQMAKEMGHIIETPHGSLVPLMAENCSMMQGLSLRNVELTVKRGKKLVFQEQGELLFTHFGVSGPLVLSASAHMGDFALGRYTVYVDLKPALDEETLDRRLLRELADQNNKDFRHVLETLAPRSLIPELLERTGVPADLKANSVTKEQRRALLETLKRFTLKVTGLRPVEEAIVTSGGVRVNEVDPRTMQSKYVPGLFFAGELLDVDAYTGGFNLQIAWSTGHAAGQGAGEFCLGDGNDDEE